jgi:hypothetical protein
LPGLAALRRLGQLDSGERSPAGCNGRTTPARAVLTHPAAAVVSITNNGHKVDQVTVRCPFCRGRHTHEWHDEPDGLRMPTCGAAASYAITITTRARLDYMRELATPDDVIGLAPLHIGYVYELDGDADVIGIVLSTSLGGFAVWLELPVAVQLAGQLVALAEDREALRERYAERLGAETSL